MASKCCTFTSKFCSTSGSVVIGRMKLENGSLSVSYTNIDGSPFVGRVEFPNCAAQYTNFVNTNFRFAPKDQCSGSDSEVACEVAVSDTASIQNGSVIRFDISILKYGTLLQRSFTIESTMAVGVLNLLPNNSFEITDKNGIISNSNKVSFKVKFKRENCAEQITLNGKTFSIVNMNSGWGNGTHTANSINLLN